MADTESRYKNIAVIITGLTVSNVNRTVSGMRRCSIERGCNLFFFHCQRRYLPGNGHDEGEYAVFALPDFSVFDGVIIMNSTIFSGRVLENVLARIEEAGIPAVSLEKIMPNMMNVYINNQAAMREIVEHMVQVHGCRRINFITGPLENNEARDRFEAYREVLEEHGIPYEAERVYFGDYMKNAGKIAAETFLRSPLPFPEAIVSSNDRMALSAYGVLLRSGKRVPEDVLLSGFDDEFEAKYHIPGLTSVARMQEEAGYTACQLALSSMGVEERGKEVCIETKAVYRESCGCCPKDCISERAFRKMHFAQEEMNFRFIGETQRLAIDLTNVDTFSQLKMTIKGFIPSIGCEQFFLFLYEDVIKKQALDLFKAREDTADTGPVSADTAAKLVLGYSKGSFHEDVAMNLETFINEVQHDKTMGFSYVVSPVHYGNRAYGYCIVANSELPFESDLYYNWIMNLGSTVESIRKQQLMRLMIQELDNMWSYDALTGIYNRAGFLKYGGRVWEESIRNNTNVLLLFLDMDGLKRINDTYGHDEGDRCLKALAEVLNHLRRHGEAVARYGGDEFVLIASRMDEACVETYMAAIHKQIDTFNNVSGAPYSLGASVGFHFIKPGADDKLSDAIDQADRSMYQTKKEKKAAAVAAPNE